MEFLQANWVWLLLVAGALWVMEEGPVPLLIRTIVLASGVAMAGPAWAAQDRPWDGWGMHPMWGAWGAWGISMMVVMLLFWGLVIAALVIGIRWLITERKPPAGDRALAVLRERYARGEINKEEFETRRRDLEAA
jgi:putative membrane protein